MEIALTVAGGTEILALARRSNNFFAVACTSQRKDSHSTLNCAGAKTSAPTARSCKLYQLAINVTVVCLFFENAFNPVFLRNTTGFMLKKCTANNCTFEGKLVFESLADVCFGSEDTRRDLAPKAQFSLSFHTKRGGGRRLSSGAIERRTPALLSEVQVPAKKLSERSVAE
ncbi:MAG: hypothetical protein FWE68_03990 [Defluviitaleaceae bacterium]|nr:hypothetical protein [Defluviitaleaceae bacterium]